MNWIWVGLGGMIGALARYSIYFLFSASAFPGLWATSCVNVLGSLFLSGVLSYLPDTPWRLFLGVGLCGSFTTFSAFSFEAISLLEQNRPFLFSAFVSANLLFSFLGFYVVRIFA